MDFPADEQVPSWRAQRRAIVAEQVDRARRVLWQAFRQRRRAPTAP